MSKNSSSSSLDLDWLIVPSAEAAEPGREPNEALDMFIRDWLTAPPPARSCFSSAA